MAGVEALQQFKPIDSKEKCCVECGKTAATTNSITYLTQNKQCLCYPAGGSLEVKKHAFSGFCTPAKSRKRRDLSLTSLKSQAPTSISRWRRTYTCKASATGSGYWDTDSYKVPSTCYSKTISRLSKAFTQLSRNKLYKRTSDKK